MENLQLKARQEALEAAKQLEEVTQYILPTFFKEKCIREEVRIGSIIIFHLRKL